MQFNFNPLSPQRERLHPCYTEWRGTSFQSTLPAKGETGHAIGRVYSVLISIHSPRKGRDLGFSGRQSKILMYFNPLSPQRERRILIMSISVCIRFQSTLPAKGETKYRNDHKADFEISIHSPRKGRDYMCILVRYVAFQSTLPAKGETQQISV